LKNAIQNLNKLLKNYSLEEVPKSYAMTQNNLGNAFNLLSKIKNKKKNINKAIDAYKTTLKIFNKDEFPEIFKLINSKIGKLTN